MEEVDEVAVAEVVSVVVVALGLVGALCRGSAAGDGVLGEGALIGEGVGSGKGVRLSTRRSVNILLSSSTMAPMSAEGAGVAASFA